MATGFMNIPLSGISSMATRQLLAELAAAYQQRTGQPVLFESVGGVDALRRVAEGEAFDVVVLASDALDKLVAAGRVLAHSRVDLVRSGVAVAVRAGSPAPDISTEEAVRAAVLAAPRLGVSTGPSGVALGRLFERWGLGEVIRARTVVPPPGVAVGSLLAQGGIDLGFQQLSELIHQPGIQLVGPLPDTIQITTTFSAGVCSSSVQPDAALRLLAFLASPEAAQPKRRQGMEPA